MATTDLAVVPRAEVAYSPPMPALVPTNIPEATTLAKMLAESSLVPQHLRGKVADCFLIVEQSMRWGLSPFAVAQATSVISGKLMFEGKLVAAVINAKADLAERLRFDYSGEGEARKVTVRGTFRGEKEPREVDVTLKEARTRNEMWQRQPDQQLAYHGARVWARRHAPEIMLGIYSPEEMPAQEPKPQPGPHDRESQLLKAPSTEAPAASGSSVEPAASVPNGSPPPATSTPAGEKPWYEADPSKMRRLQAAVGRLNLGRAEAADLGLSGKKRAEFLDEARYRYYSWAVGRPITSTTELTDGEASKVIEKAERGEVPNE